MSLKDKIAEDFGTVHRFCRANPQLNRSTVYQVVAGVYPGNTDRQADRIQAALEGRAGPEGELLEIIRQEACSRCDGGDCDKCEELFRVQAHRVAKFFQARWQI